MVPQSSSADEASLPRGEASPASTTALDQLNAQSHIRRRQRPDGLAGLNPDVGVNEELRQGALRGIASLILWINAMCVHVESINKGWGGVRSEAFKVTRIREELYTERTQKRIQNDVNGKDIVQLRNIIKKEWVRELYGNAVHLHVKDYAACVSTPHKAKEKATQGTYDSAVSNMTALSNDETTRRHHQLDFTINVIQDLSGHIRLAAQQSILTKDELRHLHFTMQELDWPYSQGLEALGRDGEHEQPLVDLENLDKWWDVDVGGNPERDSSPRNKITPRVALDTRQGANMGPSLNFILPAALLIAAIPASLAVTRAGSRVGTSEDSDFWQTITGCLLQLLSNLTFIWPTWRHPRLRKVSWFWIGIGAGLSTLCAVTSVPVYLYFPPAASVVVAFAGACVQVIIQLQVINAI